jgi:ribosome-binding protein aMBF1 (putative translation factor)
MAEVTASGTKGAKASRKKPKTRKQDLLGRFGIYLRRRREASGFSIREFARNAKMAHTNIFQFEALRKNPRLTELELLAEALHEPLAKFLGPIL